MRVSHMEAQTLVFESGAKLLLSVSSANLPIGG